MTLRDKFYNEINVFQQNFNTCRECEKIADDYAIEFAEFVFWFSKREIGKEKQLFYNQKYKNIKQLLEIFKKEKGL